ncbi:MAG TPA: prephenate dehydratase [Pseudothauera hydrothermalis]|jgi:chorismate mutase/prephenate dehydratase|uniref:prephenate dehydratase n=1 Tax=Pseudothauera hydrothermalis TaxID=2184083 RepID=UPI000C7CDE7E|nr:prephenate dehydratase [Pseudothauera hydrothermalis]AUM00467.1 chorismate mutase [Rhodocyclaceae bacterium]AVZ79665.1 prephenate dehydratase [Zoogloeaceae bacteirum Par-f-2]HNQ75101.1 prephenate dehydratase [Pseudothauera hydrothermalis]
MSDELLNLRNQIDHLDEEILARLAERARHAQRIGTIKQGNLYRPEREAQVLRRLAEANPGPLPNAAVQTIFREIMSACLALEQPLKVGYLGPAGTFSESASRKHFGSAPNFLPLATIDDVFRAVEAGNVDYGVVPVENSTEGAVGGTLDLLLANPLKICGEVNLRIHQQLLSRADGIGAAKRLYSHAQSLAQCHEWLNRNLAHLPRVPVASNAEAARLAAEDPESCAIAGEAAAELYGLKVLAANIEDDPNNTTRFLVIARHDAGPSGQDRTSLVCSAPNRPGAMHALLEPFARHGVSMTKLQSRPARAGLWEYVFYIDIEGHQSEAPVAAALQELNERAAFVKILGSYPVAAI